MAQLQLKPPDPFNFKAPDNWQKWKRRFEQFREASGLSAQSPASQINTLLYCLGEEAEDVLTSTDITAANRLIYAQVMSKFFEARTKCDPGKSEVQQEEPARR